jgi:Spy/CpxP family protein refolding chaperone
MKKLIIGALAFVLTAGAAQAQVKENGKQKANKEAKKGHRKGKHGKKAIPFHQLQLTEAQKTQLKSIREKQSLELKALKKNDQITVKALKEQKKTIHEKYKAQYQSVLTQDQKSQLAKLKAQKGNKAQKANKAGKTARIKAAKRGGGAQDLAKTLNLTPAQKDRLQQLRTDFKAKADAVRNNSSLSREQKKTQFQDLMKQQKDQMKTVLTKEQSEKLESVRKDRKNRAAK